MRCQTQGGSIWPTAKLRTGSTTRCTLRTRGSGCGSGTGSALAPSPAHHGNIPDSSSSIACSRSQCWAHAASPLLALNVYLWSVIEQGLGNFLPCEARADITPPVAVISPADPDEQPIAVRQLPVVNEVGGLGAPCPRSVRMELGFAARSVAVPPLECADEPKRVDARVRPCVHTPMSSRHWREGMLGGNVRNYRRSDQRGEQQRSSEKSKSVQP